MTVTLYNFGRLASLVLAKLSNVPVNGDMSVRRKFVKNMKTTIKNRKGEKVSVLVEQVENQKGLAFVVHGLGGFKEQPHITKMADVFKSNGISVVRFDTTNTLGESDGNYEDATVTNYYEDLEDVMAWSGSQEWYEEPFWLAAHSLGGICISLFAEKHPEKVKALAPISTTVSGKLSLETPSYEKDKKGWEETGWLVQESISKPGEVKRLKWSHMEDRLKYDLLPEAHKLTMPVLLVVGSKDESTPVGDQKILFDALPEPKEIHVIDGSCHNFRKEEYREELGEIFDNWIKSI